jgi:hypothetical protein
VVAPGDENALKKETPTIAEFFQDQARDALARDRQNGVGGTEFRWTKRTAARSVESGLDDVKTGG